MTVMLDWAFKTSLEGLVGFLKEENFKEDLVEHIKNFFEEEYQKILDLPPEDFDGYGEISMVLQSDQLSGPLLLLLKDKDPEVQRERGLRITIENYTGDMRVE